MTSVEKRSSTIVIIFTRVHRVRWGRGSRAAVSFFYIHVDYDAMPFQTGFTKINIFKVLFWEGGREGVTKKSTLCNVDNYGQKRHP